MMSSERFVPKSPLATSCRDCFFAVYEGGEQVGCAAGQLERLKSRPGVTHEMCDDPPGTTDPKSFSVLDGAACLYNRTQPWRGTPDEAREEMRRGLRVRLFVVADGPDPEPVYQAVREAAEGAYWKVSILPGENPPKRSALALWMRDNCGTPYTIDWRWGQPRPWQRILDDALHDEYMTRQKGVSVYYVVASASTGVPKNLTEWLRQVVVDQSQPLIAADGGSWYAVQTYAHRQIGGNAPAENDEGRFDGVLDKLRFAGKERGETLVLKVDQSLVGVEREVEGENS